MNTNPLTEKQLLQYAIKGIKADIDSLEKTIRQGQKYLTEYENGKQPKTKKLPQEIKSIIAEKQAEIEKLDKIRFDLAWKVDVDLNEEK